MSPAHLARRQKHAIGHSLDTKEPVAGAMRAHGAFDDVAGLYLATAVRPRRHLAADGRGACARTCVSTPELLRPPLRSAALLRAPASDADRPAMPEASDPRGPSNRRDSALATSPAGRCAVAGRRASALPPPAPRTARARPSSLRPRSRLAELASSPIQLTAPDLVRKLPRLRTLPGWRNW